MCLNYGDKTLNRRRVVDKIITIYKLKTLSVYPLNMVVIKIYENHRTESIFKNREETYLKFFSVHCKIFICNWNLASTTDYDVWGVM